MVFGTNLGGLVKQEFFKSVNVIDTIDTEVKKLKYDIYFPTIENKIRSIEPIEVNLFTLRHFMLILTLLI